MKKEKSVSLNFLYFTLLLFPILPQYIYISNNINVLNLLLIIFIFIILLINKIIKIDKIYRYMPGLWIYSIISGIRFAIDGDVLKCFTYIISFIIIPYIIVQKINTKERFLKALDIVILSGFLLGCMGLIEEILKYNPLQLLARENVSFLKEIRYGIFRIGTTFGTPIGYGIFQFFILVLINYRLNTEISKRKENTLKIFYVISLLNLLFSVSRIAIIAYFVYLLIYIFSKSKKELQKTIIITIITIIMAMVFIIVFDIKISFLEDIWDIIMQVISGDMTYKAKNTGIGDRFRLSSWVISEVDNSWLFGKGTDSIFAYKVKEGVIKKSIENQFLNTFYYTGIVGVFFLVISYLSTIKFALSEDFKYGNVLKEKRWSFLKTTFFLLLIYYIIGIGVQETDMRRLYMIIVSLMICYVRIANKEKENEICE